MAGAARYIALEGAEGCGKSTQAAWLADDLGAILTREPGSTPIGSLIRSILLDPANTALDPRAEALLNAADRAQHIAEVIGPAMSAGTHVVSDRSVYSTLAYQGFGRRLDLAQVRLVNDWAVRGCWPDLAILISVDPTTLAERMRTRNKDRLEREGEDFHDRVRDGFAQLVAAEPERWAVVDGNAGASTVRRRIRAVVTERLGI